MPNNRRSKTPNSFHNLPLQSQSQSHSNFQKVEKSLKKPSHVCENKTSLCFTQTYKQNLCKIHYLEQL